MKRAKGWHNQAPKPTERIVCRNSYGQCNQEAKEKNPQAQDEKTAEEDAASPVACWGDTEGGQIVSGQPHWVRSAGDLPGGIFAVRTN